MAVKGKGKGKGKQVAGKAPAASPANSSYGKRKVTPPDPSASASRPKKRRSGSGVYQFFDEAAVEAGSDGAESGAEDADLDLDDDFIDDANTEVKDFKGSGKAQQFPFFVKEEELSGDELEELVRQRYGHGSEYVVYDDDPDKFDINTSEIHGIKDPNIWKIKSTAGSERQIAFSLMQKFVDLQNFGSKLPIISVFTLDHVKGYVYIEADKACDVTEACKGFMNLYPSRTAVVPRNEVPQLLSVRSKTTEALVNTWVRIKHGKYKGDLAQVVAVDDGQKRVTVKLVPRIDLQAMFKKFGGGVSLKESGIPAAHLIRSSELEDFRPHIQVKRDRQTGEFFDVLDGLMLKDGFLYKKVSIGSLVCWGVQPSKAELLKFSDSNKDDAESVDWISSVYSGRKKINGVEASDRRSEVKQGNEYDLYDLVLFGQKDFGVITALENDDYQILKGGLGRSEVVTVKQQEIKNICIDKMFTASDRNKRTLYINDIVKVLEGPLEDKQGEVRHMYRGMLFIYDDGQMENSGIFCVKSELCEKIKESKGPFGRKSKCFSKGDKASSSFMPQTPLRSDQQEDDPNTFSRPYQREAGQFSVGQTLRIRKGPLKGYLCRVVAFRCKDVTVKLDSQMKVITVEESMLSVPNLRRDGPAPMSFNPFTAQDGNATTDQDQGAGLWDSRALFGSIGGNSWDKSIAPGGEQSTGWNRTTVGENSAADVNGGDSWDNASVKKEPSKIDAWEKAKLLAEHSWSNASLKKECSETDAWEKAKVPGDDARGSWGITDAWEMAKLPSEEAGGSWGTVSFKNQNKAGNWEASRGSGVNNLHNTNSENGWDISNKGKGVSLEQASWGTRTEDAHNARLDAWETKGKAVVSDADAWTKSVESQQRNLDDNKGWGRSFDNSKQTKAIDEMVTGGNSTESWDNAAACRNWSADGDGAISWEQGQLRSGAQSENWNKTKDSFKSEEGGWGKAVVSSKSQADGWSKPKSSDQAAGWDKAGVPSGSQSGCWEEVKATNAAGEGGCWGKACMSRQAEPSSWDHIKAPIGGQSESWGKGKDVEGESGEWNKSGASFRQGQSDGWNKQTSVFDDPVSSWNNENNQGGGRNDQKDSWSKPRNSEGGCGGFGQGRGRGRSSWGGGKRDNDEGGGLEDGQNNWNKRNFEGRGGSSWGRGRGRYRGRGGRGYNDSWNEAGKSEGDGILGSSDSWSKGNKYNGKKTGETSGWNMSKGVCCGEVSDWGSKSTRNEAAKEGDGILGSWSRGGNSVKETSWNNSEGCNWNAPNSGDKNNSSWNIDGDGWSKPSSFVGSRPAWNDQQAGGNNGQSSDWKGGSFSNRGHGRGRNFGGGRSSGWNGQEAADGNNTNSNRSSGWNQGGFAGGGRGDGGGRARHDSWGRRHETSDQPTGNEGGWNGKRSADKDSWGSWGSSGASDGNNANSNRSSGWNQGGFAGGGRGDGVGSDCHGSWGRRNEVSDQPTGNKGGWNGKQSADKGSWGSWGSSGASDRGDGWGKQDKAGGQDGPSPILGSDIGGDDAGGWDQPKNSSTGDGSNWNVVGSGQAEGWTQRKGSSEAGNQGGSWCKQDNTGVKEESPVRGVIEGDAGAGTSEQQKDIKSGDVSNWNVGSGQAEDRNQNEGPVAEGNRWQEEEASGDQGSSWEKKAGGWGNPSDGDAGNWGW